MPLNGIDTGEANGGDEARTVRRRFARRGTRRFPRRGGRKAASRNRKYR